MPITIDDDNQAPQDNAKPKPISNHTAAWLGALAKGRWEGGANRPAVEAAQAQGCRVSSMFTPSSASYRKANDLQKRAVLEVDDDNEEPRNGGAKRLRLSVGDSYPTHLTPPHIIRPFHQNNHYHITKTADEEAEDTLGVLEGGLRTSLRQFDQERAILRDIRVAEEQEKSRLEEERARAAELRDQQYRSAFRSNLQTMRRDYDREREVADERLKNIEREQREEAQKQTRETEDKRLEEVASIEAKLKSMWAADELDARGYRKIRPGQLSEAGQRRVREREERLRRRRL